MCDQFDGAFANNASHIFQIPGDQKTFFFRLCVHLWPLICTAENYSAVCDGTLSGSGYAVAQFVDALCYKPEGRGVRFAMVSLEFFIDIIFPAALWPCG
jgi:hypothetical protein